MALQFRVVVGGVRAEDSGALAFGCEIEASADGVEWTAVEGAPGEVTIPLTSVRAAVVSGAGDAERRQALLELFRTTVRGLPLLAGLVAVDVLEGLLPGGWPVTVGL